MNNEYIFQYWALYLSSWLVASLFGLSVDAADAGEGPGATGGWVVGGALLEGQLLERQQRFCLGIGIVGMSPGISGNSLGGNPKESPDSISKSILIAYTVYVKITDYTAKTTNNLRILRFSGEYYGLNISPFEFR